MLKDRSDLIKKGFLILILLLILIPVISYVSIQEPDNIQGTYSIIHLSDVQVLSERYPTVLNSTFIELESMKSSYNITAIIVTGDLVNDYNSNAQWQHYIDAKNKTTIPIYDLAGNHDSNFGTNWAYYDTYIGPTKHYYTDVFDDFVFIGIGYNTSPINTTTWSLFEDTIRLNPSKIPIIGTHHYMDSSSIYSNLGRSIQDILISRYSIVMCGHIHAVKQQTKTYNGIQVTEDLFDTQDFGKYSEGNLYTITKINGNVTKITTRHLALYPTKKIERPIVVFSE